MPGAPQRGVFLSYRREDTAYPAGWLFDRLVQHFGRDQVFKDVDSIPLGDDFVEVITAAVADCAVLLALIGDRWLTITGEDGRRRLDDPDDFVRLEIEAALTRNVRVIPVLVGSAQMPRPADLPASLAKLVRRQALELSPTRFAYDTGRLLKVLDSSLAEAQPPQADTEPGGQVQPALASHDTDTHRRSLSTSAPDQPEEIDARAGGEANLAARPAWYRDETGKRRLVVLDRRAVREAIRQLADAASQAKILVVNGPKGSGKSFTFLIIRFAEEPQRHQLAYVDLARRPVPGPVDLARELALRIGLSADSIPQLRVPIARGVRELAIWLVRQAQAADRDWWWVLDGLSSAQLPLQTRDFVLALAGEVRYASSLRLALLDFNEPFPADVSPFVYREELSPIEDREVRDFLRDLVVRFGRAMPDSELEELTQGLLARAPVGADRLGALSADLSKIASFMAGSHSPGPSDP